MIKSNTQKKSFEQSFHVVQFIMLFKVIFPFFLSFDEIHSVNELL